MPWQASTCVWAYPKPKPIQMLAYHTAVIMGKDADQPRNLAKSVTWSGHINLADFRPGRKAFEPMDI
jgi:hypothetical protein